MPQYSKIPYLGSLMGMVQVQNPCCIYAGFSNTVGTCKTCMGILMFSYFDIALSCFCFFLLFFMLNQCIQTILHHCNYVVKQISLPHVYERWHKGGSTCMRQCEGEGEGACMGRTAQGGW